MLIVVAPPQHAERLLHAISLAVSTSKASLSLPLTVGLHGVDEELPRICDRGIQFYGTQRVEIRRRMQAIAPPCAILAVVADRDFTPPIDQYD
ncbi:hypothetical protein [Metallibacterium sp.]|uniref:hypothetical protein n=1 Tax=Metallibacterium sp. TaxID=2940281 RepID=UPI002639C393|nr:hypothetical protein [Metallibacterium sp.]